VAVFKVVNIAPAPYPGWMVYSTQFIRYLGHPNQGMGGGTSAPCRVEQPELPTAAPGGEPTNEK
jgi:hypothetical protein